MILLVGAIIALVVALVHEFQAGGRDLVGWAVAILCVAIIIAHFA